MIGYDGETLIDGIPYSLSTSTDVKVNIDTANELVKKRGDSFGVFSYAQRSILSFIYYALYGTTADIIYGDIHKFLNIVAFCSNWQEILSGCEINNRVCTITNLDGTKRTIELPSTGGDFTDSGYNAGNIKKIHIGKYLDILPKEFGASYNTGYCSYAWTSNKNNCFPRIKGGTSLNSQFIGCGYDDNNNNQRFRLTYQGKIIETKDTEYFNSINT